MLFCLTGRYNHLPVQNKPSYPIHWWIYLSGNPDGIQDSLQRLCIKKRLHVCRKWHSVSSPDFSLLILKSSLYYLSVQIQSCALTGALSRKDFAEHHIQERLDQAADHHRDSVFWDPDSIWHRRIFRPAVLPTPFLFIWKYFHNRVFRVRITRISSIEAGRKDGIVHQLKDEFPGKSKRNLAGRRECRNIWLKIFWFYQGKQAADYIESRCIHSSLPVFLIFDYKAF